MNKRVIYNAIDRPEAWGPLLADRRVGLVTNPSGVDRELRLTSDILFEAGCLACMFSPEHGVRGDRQAGEHIDTYTDQLTGLPVHSLYGHSNHIDPDVLRDLDAVAFDVQDVGARFYTYIYTLSRVMEDCAAAGKQVIVLDRLNPLGGMAPQGTILEPAFASGVGRYPIATRFNMTVGEYARYINQTQHINCPLTVVPIEGWTRDCLFCDTDLPWVAPSPNLPTVDAAFCYIGTCIFEGTNLSEGRGTTHPFEAIGAPWLNADEVAAYMRALDLPGVKFRPCHFTPTFSKHRETLCHGVRLHITDHVAFRPFEVGLYLLTHIRESYPDFAFREPGAAGISFVDLLLGCDDLRREDFDLTEFLARQQKKLEVYEKEIMEFYMY